MSKHLQVILKLGNHEVVRTLRSDWQEAKEDVAAYAIDPNDTEDFLKDVIAESLKSVDFREMLTELLASSTQT